MLASGSKGNACLVEGPSGHILVDCGLSRRELCRRAGGLGVRVDDIRAVLLTHEHSDHVAGLTVFMSRFPGELYATDATMGARSYLRGLDHVSVVAGEELEVAGIHVRTFPTSHDVADPMGFRFDAGGDSIGYCTDTGTLGPQAMDALRDARILALESNHDAGMLARGPYPGFLKERVAGQRGHLSNDQAAAALTTLVGPSTRTVVGMHLSQENNRPSLCVRALAGAVGAEATNEAFTEACTPDGRIRVSCAAQDAPRTFD